MQNLLTSTSGACKAIYTASAVHPKCVSFVRKTASMEDVHPFPTIGGNVAQRQRGVLNSTASAVHPECVSFVRKTASMEDVHPLPLRGRCRASDRWGSYKVVLGA